MRIFISYRRADTQGATARITDRLSTLLGEKTLFRDIYDIDPGADFASVLRQTLEQSAIVLPIIGTRWQKEIERRSAQHMLGQTDWVRYEVASALTRKSLVIPLLINGAALPSADELPPDLAGLADCTPLRIQEETFEADVVRLADLIVASHVGHDVLQTALCELLAFTPADLQDNRDGRLSQAQRSALSGFVWWAGGALVSALFLMYLVGTLLLIQVGAMVCFVALPAVQAFVVGLFVFVFVNTIKNRAVTSTSGVLHGGSSSEVLIVGGEELKLTDLRIPLPALELLQKFQFRAYYRLSSVLPFAAKERNLLSIEPLR